MASRIMDMMATGSDANRSQLTNLRRVFGKRVKTCDVLHVRFLTCGAVWYTINPVIYKKAK